MHNPTCPVGNSNIFLSVLEITSVIVLLGVMALMFITPLWQPEDSHITNSVIAILGGISLFVLPKTRSESLMNWAGIEKLPFGLLFLLRNGHNHKWQSMVLFAIYLVFLITIYEIQTNIGITL